MPNSALNRTQTLVLTNKSGGGVAFGDVVVLSVANASAFTTTTVSRYGKTLVGVVLEPDGIPNDATGLIAFGGWVPQVNLSSAASIGDWFHTHTVAKQALRHAAPVKYGDFGMALNSGTTPPAVLTPGIASSGVVDIQEAVGTTDISSNTVNWVDMAEMAITLVMDADGRAEIEFQAGVGASTNGTVARYRLTKDGAEIDPPSYVKARVAASTVAQPLFMKATLPLVAGTYLIKAQWYAEANTIYNRAAADNEQRVLTVKKWYFGAP